MVDAGVEPRCQTSVLVCPEASVEVPSAAARAPVINRRR
jgi:hypothetical protein